MSTALTLHPPSAPVDACCRIAGSKSITNRALVAAALAEGRSVLEGALVADDTLAMRDALRGLGIEIAARDDGRTLTIRGCAGVPRAATSRLDGRSAGTVARFLPPLLALGSGEYELDGSAQMRARPLGAGVGALLPSCGNQDRRAGLRGEDLPGLLRRLRGGDGHHRGVNQALEQRARVDVEAHSSPRSSSSISWTVISAFTRRTGGNGPPFPGSATPPRFPGRSGLRPAAGR